MLAVSYNTTTDEFQFILLDYSYLEQTGKIKITSLNTQKSEEILATDINKKLDKVWENMSMAKSKAVIAVEQAFQEDSIYRNTHCKW